MDECKPLPTSAATSHRTLSGASNMSVSGATREKGLTSFTLELNLSTFETHSLVKLVYVGHKDSSS